MVPPSDQPHTLSRHQICDAVNQENTMHKYANDTYLVVPAANHQSYSSEIETFEKWAAENNLVLNRKKSGEIVFVASRSRRTVDIPPPAVPSITRVESIKALGVTISRTFSVSQHVENLLAACENKRRVLAAVVRVLCSKF